MGCSPCGGAPKAPAAPDPVATANAQAAVNKETAITNAQLNRINQYSPYGSLTYTSDYSATDKPVVEGYQNSIKTNNAQIQQLQMQQAAAQAKLLNGTPQERAAAQAQINQLKSQIDPLQKQNDTYNQSLGQYTPIYTQNINLSPEQQQLLDYTTQGEKNQAQIALGMQGQVGNSYANPIDTSGLFGLSGRVQQDGGTTANAIKQAQDAAYKAQTQYLDPRYERDQKALDVKLANQGLSSDSEAYKNSMDMFSEQKRADYSNAQNAAVGAGFQQQNTLFNQGLANSNLQNAANAQQLQELFAVRNQPLAEYNALMGGTQVQNPQFSSVPVVGVDSPDMAGYINQNYQGQLNNYNAKVGQQNATMGAVGSLLGTAGSLYGMGAFK